MAEVEEFIKKGGIVEYGFKTRVKNVDGQNWFNRTSYTTREEAQAALDEIQSGSLTNVYVPNLNRKFEVLIDEYMDHIKYNIRASTLESYTAYVDNMIRPFLGHKKIKEINFRTLDAYFKEISFNYEGAQRVKNFRKLNNVAKGIKHGTARYLRTILNGICERATTMGEFKENPMRKIRVSNNLTVKEIVFFTKEEQNKILDALKNHRNKSKIPYIAAMLGFYAGLRFGELAGLPWKNVNFEENTIDVQQQFNSAVNRITHELKTEASRGKVPMIKELREALWAFKQNAIERKMAEGKTFSEDDLVLENGRERAVKNSILTRSIKNECKKIGIDKFYPHAMRHTFAMNCVRAKLPITETQLLMRHGKWEETIRYYLHLEKELPTESLAMLEAYMAR
jgi:integrase